MTTKTVSLGYHDVSIRVPVDEVNGYDPSEDEPEGTIKIDCTLIADAQDEDSTWESTTVVSLSLARWLLGMDPDYTKRRSDPTKE